MIVDTSSMTKEEIQQALEDAVFNMMPFDDRVALSEKLSELISDLNPNE